MQLHHINLPIISLRARTHLIAVIRLDDLTHYLNGGHVVVRGLARRVHIVEAVPHVAVSV